MPTAILIRLEMRYMYLAPHMKAMNVTVMKGQVTAPF